MYNLKTYKLINIYKNSTTTVLYAQDQLRLTRN